MTDDTQKMQFLLSFKANKGLQWTEELVEKTEQKETTGYSKLKNLMYKSEILKLKGFCKQDCSIGI